MCPKIVWVFVCVCVSLQVCKWVMVVCVCKCGANVRLYWFHKSVWELPVLCIYEMNLWLFSSIELLHKVPHWPHNHMNASNFAAWLWCLDWDYFSVYDFISASNLISDFAFLSKIMFDWFCMWCFCCCCWRRWPCFCYLNGIFKTKLHNVTVNDRETESVLRPCGANNAKWKISK